MTQWLLTEFNHQRFEQRARWSGCAEPEKPGHLRLFNRNAGETWHVRIVEQCPDRCAWIVEADDVPDYFRNVVEAIP